jgi:hypothetical protein
VIAPTVHLGGTSRQDLLDQFMEAGHALSLALSKMREAVPNGRDYTTGGWDELALAMHEHSSRVARVQSVMDEYGALCEAVCDPERGG